MKRLLTISAVAAVVVGVFLGACVALSGGEVAITPEGIRAVTPEAPQPETPTLKPDATGAMLGKDVTSHDAEQVVRILNEADKDARAAKAIFPGVFLPDHYEMWKNDATGATHKMSVHMPSVKFGGQDSCRNFTLVSAVGGAYAQFKGVACPEPGEKWSLHNSTGLQ